MIFIGFNEKSLKKRSKIIQNIGNQWYSLSFNDYHYFSMLFNFNEFQLELNEFHWISINFNWISMKFIEFQGISIEFQWKSLKNNGNHWNSMNIIDLQGFSIIFIVFNDFHWFSIVFIILNYLMSMNNLFGELAGEIPELNKN